MSWIKIVQQIKLAGKKKKKEMIEEICKGGSTVPPSTISVNDGQWRLILTTPIRALLTSF